MSEDPVNSKKVDEFSFPSDIIFPGDPLEVYGAEVPQERESCGQFAHLEGGVNPDPLCANCSVPYSKHRLSLLSQSPVLVIPARRGWPY